MSGTVMVAQEVVGETLIHATLVDGQILEALSIGQAPA
jgi:hypothetical protein